MDLETSGKLLMFPAFKENKDGYIYIYVCLFFSLSLLFPEGCNTETGFGRFPILQLCVDTFNELLS